MEWEQRRLINELTQGKSLAEQLRKHLNPSSSSPEIRRFLADKILCSYQKALSLLNLDALMATTNPQLVKNCTVVNSCPRSPVDQCRGKKRKMEPRWTEKVKACLESDMAEGVLDDGYSWRKYGQKEILGAVFPRGYYRCRHRNSQGCLATKQVQKSDTDPTVFQVTYRGQHSCGFQSDGGDSSPGKKSRTSTEAVVSDLVGNGFDNLPSFVPSPGATVVPFGFDGDGNVHNMLSPAISGTTNYSVENDFAVVGGSVEAGSTANSPMGNLDVSIDGNLDFDVNFFLDLEGDLLTMV
ncbi:Probable WRKY transcription factor 41 [Linum perenne]